MTDQQPKWHFKKLMAGEALIDTVGGEFFSLEALKDEALPRETGQNSLDSNTKLNRQIEDDKKLILKIQFHETSKKTLEQSVFLKGLYQHSSNPDSGIPQHSVPQLDQKFKYLVIEDFNTTGVRGDMDFNAFGENQDQDLFNLYRSIGMTGKDLDNEDNLGSWGLGKNMYAQTSRLSSFLGYSCREHDTDAEFLFGMSILKLHKVDGTAYKNVGNFGHGDDNNESIINGRALTNIGTFRAYLKAYLKNNKNIHENMTFLVRQLSPTEKGLPIQIYVFANNTNWIDYEEIQSDIFDHLIASLDQFDLKIYQNPSGNDLSKLNYNSNTQ